MVGPMGGGGFTLPNVERALVEMEGGLGLGSSVGDARAKPRRVSKGFSCIYTCDAEFNARGH